MLSAEADHNPASLEYKRAGQEIARTHTVSKKSIRNTRDQSRRQLEVLEEMPTPIPPVERVLKK